MDSSSVLSTTAAAAESTSTEVECIADSTCKTRDGDDGHEKTDRAPDFLPATRVDSEDESYNESTGIIGNIEKSLEETLFSNELLLEKIFKHSTFKDLKSYRQLNRLWNLEATKGILSRFSLNPINLTTSGTRLHLRFPVKFMWTLNKFQSLVEQSRIFPCNSFLIQEAHPLEDKLLTFLKAHGSLFKSLVYEPGPSFTFCMSESDTGGDGNAVKIHGSPTSIEFIQLLADNLPNLEILDLRTCPSVSQNMQESSGSCLGAEAPSMKIEPTSIDETLILGELKQLHTLTISCEISEELLSLMLNKCKNLKHIHLSNNNDNDCSLQNIVKLNAVHLLKKMCFRLDGDSISLYEQVVKQELRCQEIEVKWGHRNSPQVSEAYLPRVGRILSEAFYKCSDTLEILTLGIPLGHIPELRFFTCPKVTRVFVEYRHDEDLPMNLASEYDSFPPDFNVGVLFPKVDKLEPPPEDDTFNSMRLWFHNLMEGGFQIN